MKKTYRMLKRALWGVFAVLLAVAAFFTVGLERPSDTMTWGASFSKRAAEGLGLDWKKAYIAALDDLKISHLRIGSYWDEIEPQEGRYNFSDLDFQISEAASRGRRVILTLGRRQPRWPECHVPEWAKSLGADRQNEKMLEQVKKVVERYKGRQAIEMWQVENEYFLTSFGICAAPDPDFFAQEASLVRSLDARPILTTDSGELSHWFRAASYGDVFGTTMYRRVYNPIFGVMNWPYPPVYYSRLGALVKAFTRSEKIIIAELQAEPWAKTTLNQDTTQTNYETMSPAQFENNLDFARKSGIDAAYLWGLEWWYYMKEKRNVPFFWDNAKKLWVK